MVRARLRRRKLCSEAAAMTKIALRCACAVAIAITMTWPCAAEPFDRGSAVKVAQATVPITPLPGGTAGADDPPAPRQVPPSPEPQPRVQKQRAAREGIRRLLQGLAQLARAAVR